MAKRLTDALDAWDVLSPGAWDNELSGTSVGGWYAVSNERGIVAYFGSEEDACRFRLNEVNRLLNG